MNDETAPQTYQEDDTPTKPVGKPTGGWVMPEPVFRKSSGGTLPRRLGLGPDGQPAAPAAETGEQTPTGAVPNGSGKSAAVPVAEQPDLSADFSVPDDTAAPPAAKSRSGTAKILLIVLGLAGILLVIGIFLVVIYFLFFARFTESQTF